VQAAGSPALPARSCSGITFTKRLQKRTFICSTPGSRLWATLPPPSFCVPPPWKTLSRGASASKPSLNQPQMRGPRKPPAAWQQVWSIRWQTSARAPPAADRAAFTATRWGPWSAPATRRRSVAMPSSPLHSNPPRTAASKCPIHSGSSLAAWLHRVPGHRLGLGLASLGRPLRTLGTTSNSRGHPMSSRGNEGALGSRGRLLGRRPQVCCHDQRACCLQEASSSSSSSSSRQHNCHSSLEAEVVVADDKAAVSCRLRV
jgi:hypothetical protein